MNRKFLAMARYLSILILAWCFSILLLGWGLGFSILHLAWGAADAPPAVGAGEPGPSSVPSLPGITSRDPFPRGCVDCHVVLPEENRDVRISTLMTVLSGQVPPELLARVQALNLSGKTLQGRHPIVSETLNDIPSGCLKCHTTNSDIAPPFSGLIHLLHLGGGNNHYMSLFQGQCLYCHKYNGKTGAWSIPSGPEN